MSIVPGSTSRASRESVKSSRSFSSFGCGFTFQDACNFLFQLSTQPIHTLWVGRSPVVSTKIRSHGWRSILSRLFDHWATCSASDTEPWRPNALMIFGWCSCKICFWWFIPNALLALFSSEISWKPFLLVLLRQWCRWWTHQKDCTWKNSLL